MIVENLARGTKDPDGLGIGAVGEIEAAQTIIRCSKPQPSFSIARMLFDRQPEMFLGETEIVGAVLLLAQAQFIVGIAAEQTGRGFLARRARDGAGRFLNWRHMRRSVYRQMRLGRFVDLSGRRRLRARGLGSKQV